MRLATEVVSKERAWTNREPFFSGEPVLHQLPKEQYDLCFSYDQKAVLVLSGNTLRVLDAQGIEVIRTSTFKTPYLKFRDRPEYYVGLASNSLDIVDKSTSKFRKHIEIPGSGATDLALHPNKPLAFVTVYDDKGGKRNGLEAKCVVLVDEKLGAATILPRVHAQWVTFHPSGEFLYTALNSTFAIF